MKKYDKAMLEIKKTDPDIAKVLCLLREARDHRAEYALATWYLHGAHVEQDFAIASKMLRSAAAKGNSSAMFDLAVFLEKGDGGIKHDEEAFLYYVSAAFGGDKQAIAEVGRMIYYGIGTTKNVAIAEIWLRRAERNGITIETDANDVA